MVAHLTVSQSVISLYVFGTFFDIIINEIGKLNFNFRRFSCYKNYLLPFWRLV